MKRRLFIVVPAPTPDGPVKGAYALANALAALRAVTLVTLKRGPGAQAPLDPRVEQVCLADHAHTFRGKVRHYRQMLTSAGGRNKVCSISMCLSADALNLLCKKHAVICASVRGNLIVNYRMDYGAVGVPLAMAHLTGLRGFDHVAVMTDAMAEQVQRYVGHRPTVVGNFVDEAALEVFRTSEPAEGPLRFAFVGSLSTRKQPWLLVEAVASLRDRGQPAVIDLIGSGPMDKRVHSEMSRLHVDGAVRLWGFVEQPYAHVSQADALVLPSVSEGLPRAALESLHLGVPCVLRRADGNGDLIVDGVNGALFAHDAALADAMLQAASISRRRGAARESLLPAAFRQDAAARRYLDLVEQ